MCSSTAAGRLGALLRHARRTFRPDIAGSTRWAHAIRDAGHGRFSPATVRGAETGNSPASENLVVAYERLCGLPQGALTAWREAMADQLRESRPALAVQAGSAVDDEQRGAGSERTFGDVLRCARETFAPGRSMADIAEKSWGGDGASRLLSCFEQGDAVPGERAVTALEAVYAIPAGTLACWRTALTHAGSASASAPPAPYASAPATDAATSPRDEGDDSVADAKPASGNDGARTAVRARRRPVIAALALAAVLTLGVALVLFVPEIGDDAPVSHRSAASAAAPASPGGSCVPRHGAAGHGRSLLAGRILTPRSGEHLSSRVFYATGRLDGPISAHRHVWLAVRIKQGLVPKGDEVATARWRVRIDEPFAKRVDLVLLELDDEGNQQILEWFNDGLRTGEYPPFDLSGAVVLDESCQVTLGATRRDVTLRRNEAQTLGAGHKRSDLGSRVRLL